jgi:hypothetical protein
MIAPCACCPEPCDGRRPSSADLLVEADAEVTDDDDIGAFASSKVRSGVMAIPVPFRMICAAFGHDARLHASRLHRPAGQVSPAGTDERQNLVESMKHPGRHFGHRDETDRETFLGTKGVGSFRETGTFGPLLSSPSLTALPQLRAIQAVAVEWIAHRAEPLNGPTHFHHRAGPHEPRSALPRGVPAPARLETTPGRASDDLHAARPVGSLSSRTSGMRRSEIGRPVRTLMRQPRPPPPTPIHRKDRHNADPHPAPAPRYRR